MSALPEGSRTEVTPATRFKLDALRIEVGERGIDIRLCSNLALSYVLTACLDDVGLASDALVMHPRPKWLEEIIGRWKPLP